MDDTQRAVDLREEAEGLMEGLLGDDASADNSLDEVEQAVKKTTGELIQAYGKTTKEYNKLKDQEKEIKSHMKDLKEHWTDVEDWEESVDDVRQSKFDHLLTLYMGPNGEGTLDQFRKVSSSHKAVLFNMEKENIEKKLNAIIQSAEEKYTELEKTSEAKKVEADTTMEKMRLIQQESSRDHDQLLQKANKLASDLTDKRIESSALEEKRRTLEGLLEERFVEIRRLNDRVGRRNDTIRVLEAESREQLEEASELESNYQNLKTDHEKHVKSLQTTIDEKESELSKEKGVLKEWDGNYRILYKRYQERKEDLKKEEKKVKNLNDSLASEKQKAKRLEGELQASQNQARLHEADLNSKKTMVQELEDKLKTSQDGLSTKKQVVESLQIELGSEKQKVVSLQGDLEKNAQDYRTEVERLEGLLELEQNKVKELEDDLDESINHDQRRDDEIERLEAELDGEKEEVKRLEGDLQASKKTARDSDIEVERLKGELLLEQRKVEDLEEDLNDSRQKAQRRGNEVKSLMDDLHQKKEEIKTIGLELDLEQGKAKKLKENLKDSRQQAQERDTKLSLEIKRLESDLDMEKKKVERLDNSLNVTKENSQKELSTEKETVKTLEEKLNKEQKEVERLETELSSEKEKTGELETNLGLERDEVAKLSGKLKTSEGETQDRKKELDQGEIRIENLQKSIDKMQSELDLKQQNVEELERSLQTSNGQAQGYERDLQEKNSQLTRELAKSGELTQDLEARGNEVLKLNEDIRKLEDGRLEMARCWMEQSGGVANPESWIPFVESLRLGRSIATHATGEDRAWTFVRPWFNNTTPQNPTFPTNIIGLVVRLRGIILASSWSSESVEMVHTLVGMVEQMVEAPIDVILELISLFKDANLPAQGHDLLFARLAGFGLWQLACLIQRRWLIDTETIAITLKNKVIANARPLYALSILIGQDCGRELKDLARTRQDSNPHPHHPQPDPWTTSTLFESLPAQYCPGQDISVLCLPVSGGHSWAVSLGTNSIRIIETGRLVLKNLAFILSAVEGDGDDIHIPCRVWASKYIPSEYLDDAPL